MCAFVLQCSCACAWNMCNIGTSQDYKPTSLRSQKAVASVWAKCAQPFPMEAPQHNLNERFRNISNTKQCTLALSQRRRHCIMCEGNFATKKQQQQSTMCAALMQWRQTCVKCFWIKMSRMKGAWGSIAGCLIVLIIFFIFHESWLSPWIFRPRVMRHGSARGLMCLGTV